MEASLKPGQLVRVNLAGVEVEGVTFHSAVTDAPGRIVHQTTDDPQKYLVRLLFSFRGINEVEVPLDRISRRIISFMACQGFGLGFEKCSRTPKVPPPYH